MSENFVPEMHDLGKLIAAGATVLTTDGKLKWHREGAFANVDWGAWGVDEPQTVTWAVICHREFILDRLEAIPRMGGFVSKGFGNVEIKVTPAGEKAF
jgi:hypothetical protein